MRVTEIAEVSRSRMKISTDEELTFVLYRGELRRLRIRQGEEIEEEALRAIREEILPKRAKLRAMNLLKNRDYTVKQLRDKLVQGEYGENIIEEAIAYVRSYGYIDDRKYAEDFISCHMADRSRKKIEMDLYRRGIDRKIIEEIMEQMEEEGEGPDEFSAAQKLLKKKNFDSNTAGNKEKQKMSAFLYRKGFNMDIIRRVLLLDITSI